LFFEKRKGEKNMDEKTVLAKLAARFISTSSRFDLSSFSSSSDSILSNASWSI